MNGFRRIAAVGFLLAGLFVVPGCATDGDSDPGALTEVSWELVGSSMSSVDLGAAGISAIFDGERISGFSGVNQYGGPYTAEKNGNFKVGEIAGTLMAGPEPLMKSESAYLKLLEGCDSFEVQSGKLTLSTNGNETLSFDSAQGAELPGTNWTVTGYNNGRQAVVSPALDSTLTIDFGTEGAVSGHGGVNRFSGTFTSEAKSVSIGPLASTRMADLNP